jgi:hypothetical protein
MDDAADSTVETVDAVCDEIAPMGLESKDASRDE